MQMSIQLYWSWNPNECISRSVGAMLEQKVALRRRGGMCRRVVFSGERPPRAFDIFVVPSVNEALKERIRFEKEIHKNAGENRSNYI